MKDNELSIIIICEMRMGTQPVNFQFFYRINRTTPTTTTHFSFTVSEKNDIIFEIKAIYLIVSNGTQQAHKMGYNFKCVEFHLTYYIELFTFLDGFSSSGSSRSVQMETC